MKLLIKNSSLVCPFAGLLNNVDILIDGDRIAAVEKNLPECGCEIFPAAGKYVFPGFIDMHCHLRDPGFEYKETLKSGMQAAVKGGFSTLACMPNTSPVADNKLVVEYLLNHARLLDICNILPVGAITKNSAGVELSNIGSLKNAGAIALSDDGHPVSNPAILLRALRYAGMYDLLILSHSEELALSDDGVMNEGITATILGLKGIPALAEELAINRDILLSENSGRPIHIMHVSTAGSVAAIRTAKKRGIKVSAETCPHYFSLTEEACDNFNTFAKVNPPLRQQQDIAAIISGLQDGTIDAIATDHAPHSEDEKNCDFATATFGISGLETAFAAAYTNLVQPGFLSLQELAQKMSANPAQILGLEPPRLAAGAPANITLVDTAAHWVVDRQEFVSMGKNTPFHGKTLHGKVELTIVNGQIKYRR